jgi:hypothetical protein
VLQVRTIYTYIYIYSNCHLIFPIYISSALRSKHSLIKSNARCKFICWPNFILKTFFKSYCGCKSKPTALIPAVAEPPELHRLKYASPLSRAPTYFRWCNPLVCRVSARYNHGLTGSKQVYFARRRVYKHSRAHQHLIYREVNIITNLA